MLRRIQSHRKPVSIVIVCYLIGLMKRLLHVPRWRRTSAPLLSCKICGQVDIPTLVKFTPKYVAGKSFHTRYHFKSWAIQSPAAQRSHLKPWPPTQIVRARSRHPLRTFRSQYLRGRCSKADNWWLTWQISKNFPLRRFR
jgi:hypothetical protein